MANRLLTFARLAFEVAQSVVPDRRHRFAPKRYTQPQLLACVLVKEYLGLDYRTAREAIEISGPIRDAFRLVRVPDHTTLWRFARDGATPDVVAEALAETVARLKASGRESGPDPPGGLQLVAIDSTGLPPRRGGRAAGTPRGTSTNAGRRALRRPTRRGRTRGGRLPRPWAAALWIGPQLVTAQLSKPGPCGDYPDLPPLAEASTASVPGAVILADAGYDCESNHVFCRDRLRVGTLIPAKTRRHVAGPRRPHRAEMVRMLGCATLGVEGRPDAMKTYRQRWLVETLMSVVKRKWGERLTARLPAMQETQALLRGLVYNLYRLVVLGVRPTLAGP